MSEWTRCTIGQMWSAGRPVVEPCGESPAFGPDLRLKPGLARSGLDDVGGDNRALAGKRLCNGGGIEQQPRIHKLFDTRQQFPPVGGRLGRERRGRRPLQSADAKRDPQSRRVQSSHSLPQH